MTYEVLVTCNDGKRNYAIKRLKEFQDIKNIQQRKNPNEVLAKVESNDKNYVMTNIVQRIQDIDGISGTSVLPFV
jgi:ppGpp synthetase/RelA/SpoT-type nucleotidyltranferase